MFNLNIIITTLAFLFVFVSAQWPKRGLPYNNPPQHIQNWKDAGSQVNWAYDWNSYIHPDFPHYMEYVPMLWSDATEHTGGWYILFPLPLPLLKSLLTFSSGSVTPTMLSLVAPVISSPSTSPMVVVQDNHACPPKMPPMRFAPT